MNRFQKKADELVSSYRKPEKDADKLSALRNVIDKARRDLL